MGPERKAGYRYLRAMGIVPWVSRQWATVATNVATGVMVPALATTSVAAAETGGLSMGELGLRVAACQSCDLQGGRTQTVFGIGDVHATWMIIGEAPGAEEDRQGEPFVGRAGKLLNNMLQAVGLRREQVYIANILKCRPPNNRDPRPEEVMACLPYLVRQIQLVQPKLIIALGRIAAQNLLQRDETLGQMRGRTFDYGASRIPVVVTYHPAYLLRSPQEKAKAWQDLLLASRIATPSTSGL